MSDVAAKERETGRPLSGHLGGHLAMLVFSALVAGSFSLGAMAAPHIAPAAMTAPRFLLAAVLVGVAAMATTGLPRKSWRARGAMSFWAACSRPISC